MFSGRVILISTTVLSAAAAVMLSTAGIDVYAPWIYNGVVSWLQPPYLYLVINCIIITIVASSELQSTTDGASVPPSLTPLLGTIPVVQPQLVEIIPTDFLTPTADYKYESVRKGSKSEDSPTAKDKVGDSPTAADRIEDSRSIVDDAMSNKENEGNVVAKSSDDRNLVKPPPSARSGHRRNAKISPEGGRRRVLGVSKAKKQDTLENTWKAITEGRPIPISRHLNKSDTWAHTHHQQENTPPLKNTMRKAETFNDRSAATNADASPATGEVRKEPSLSQDELNRRVEAFIKKFNEDMRLQRQESLKHHTQMVNH